MKRFSKISVCAALIVSLVFASLPIARAEAKFDSVAELLEIKSHIEKDAGMGTYATVQGACTDGNNAYFAVQSGSTVILKYSMSTWELRKKATVSGLGHANDMAYDSKRKRLVVANNNTEDDCLTLLDPNTLKVTGTVIPREDKSEKDIKKEAKEKDVPESEIEKTRDLRVYCVAYNEKRDNYVVGLSGSYKFALLDSDFRLIKKFNGVDTGLTRQGCDCDDDYIYFAQSGGSNAVAVYDYSGDRVGMPSLDHSHEVENIFHVGKNFYLTLHYYGNSVRRVGLSQDTQIRFSIRYEPAGAAGKMKDSSVHYGVDTKLSKCAFTKPGAFFGGWTVRRGSDGKYLGFRLGAQKHEWLDESEMNAPSLFKDEAKVSKLVKFGGVILTARWINESYGIHFDSDVGEGWMAPASVGYDEEYALPACGFSRQGYIFCGYKAERDIDGSGGSDSPEWLRPADMERAHLFEKGEKASRLTYDGSVTFTAQFTFAFRFSEDMDTLTGYVGVDESVDIPTAEGRLRTIGSGAFTGDSVMRELRIPSCVDTIEQGAVSACPNLEAVYFENSLPRDIAAEAITDSGSQRVYLVRGGTGLCLGFYSGRHSLPLIRFNYKQFDRGFLEYIRGMMKPGARSEELGVRS